MSTVQQEMPGNKVIARNTMFMYFRMTIVLVIALFTSRINLQSLGVIDYGIYGVVGGFVSMFTIFSNSLSAAISRFIAFELGKGDANKLKRVFSTSVSIQIILAIALMLLAEIAGNWFLHNKMVIPEDRIYAATWVLHCSVISLGISLINVPYNAAIVAHEKMSVFAYISIYEVIAKLGICYFLFVSPIDRLILWAFTLVVLQISIWTIYITYCNKQFEECKYHPIIDKSLFKEISGFAGWSMIGLAALTCYTQGLNMVLNIFFGPIVNAARSIADQVQNAIQGFSTNLQVAINPQLIKSYANNDIQRVHELIFMGSRYCFYLLLLLSLPIVMEAPLILKIWLGEYPDHTANFIRLILTIIIFDSSFGGLISTAQTATGKIKIYQIVVGGIMLSILPVSYFIIKVWHTVPETVYYVYAGAVVCAHIARMLIIRPMINLSLRKYAKEVVFPILRVLICATIIPVTCFVLLPKDNLVFSLFTIIISMACSAISIWFVGLTKREKDFIVTKVKSFKGKR